MITVPEVEEYWIPAAVLSQYKQVNFMTTVTAVEENYHFRIPSEVQEEEYYIPWAVLSQ